MSEIITFVISKVAPKSDFTITQSDLKNTDVVNEFEKLSNIVLVLGEVIEDLDLQSFNDIKEFAQNIKAEELLNEGETIGDINGKAIKDAELIRYEKPSEDLITNYFNKGFIAEEVEDKDLQNYHIHLTNVVK